MLTFGNLRFDPHSAGKSCTGLLTVGNYVRLNLRILQPEWEKRYPGVVPAQPIAGTLDRVKLHLDGQQVQLKQVALEKLERTTKDCILATTREHSIGCAKGEKSLGSEGNVAGIEVLKITATSVKAGARRV